MVLANPLEVRIKKQHNDEEFLNYIVEYPRAHKPGEIDAVIEQMQEAQMAARPLLESLDIAPHEKVVDLSYFYPHTEAHNRNNDFKNRGIGTAALNQVIADAKAQGAIAIYCVTYSLSLREFLPNRGFETSIHNPVIFAKRID